jgi:probable F420-dependent oxidoreductase
VSELRRVERMGFHSVAVSHHVTRGWQLGLIPAMAFAAASTTRLRVLSLVAQNDLQHPALLAKDIATIDVLSGGRAELGVGPGWLTEDYHVLGQTMYSPGTRVSRLSEALEVLRRYFHSEYVDFEGEHYRVNHMEAMPRCVQKPNPPILVGAGSPRMLDLAGRTADIVGIHAAMVDNRIDVGDLTASSVETKVGRIRAAATDAGRPTPALQFSCHYVRVTDAAYSLAPRSSWSADVESEIDALKGSPAALVGSAAECAAQILEWRDRFGITYWNLGADLEAVSRIIDQLGAEVAT